MLLASIVVVGGACQATPLPSLSAQTALDPFVRHPFFDGATSVAGTLEQAGTCVGLRRRDTGEWVMLLWPETATTMSGGALSQIRLGTTVLTTGQGAHVSGLWAVGGTEPWTFLDTQGIRSRCPADDYFFLIELTTSSP